MPPRYLHTPRLLAATFLLAIFAIYSAVIFDVGYDYAPTVTVTRYVTVHEDDAKEQRIIDSLADELCAKGATVGISSEGTVTVEWPE